MGTKLNNSAVIHVLAGDLGLGQTANPVEVIVDYCKSRVKRFLDDFRGLGKPSELLCLVANKLGTRFIIIDSDADLHRIVKEYAGRGEVLFAKLEEELADDVFGITLKLLHPGRFDLPFVSIIDCRGSKARKVYFTKWHELGHLLILTDQRRFQFKRTHSLHEPKSPEESLVDILAGEFAYYGPMVKPLAVGEISFEAIEAVRQELCPEGSFTSGIIGVAKAWPHACISIEASMASKKGDGDPNQPAFEFLPPPVQALRAVHVTLNELARKRGIQFYPNFRVPSASVISRVFREQLSGGEATENLNWWRASDGTQLANLRLVVRAKRVGQSVYALLIPQFDH